MIINNTHKFVFVHVPKVAGTSVSMFLSKLTKWCDLELGSTNFGEDIEPHYRDRFKLAKHGTAREIRKVVGDDVWAKYFTFGFVRNPYERAYSVWEFLRWIQQDRPMEQQHAVLVSLDTFDKFVSSDYFKGTGIDRLLMPQFFWLRADQASETLGVKFVGRLESLGESMKEIAARIGIPAPDMSDFPTKNESERPGSVVWQLLDANPEIEKTLYTRYELDFRLFGYERYTPRAK